MSKKKISGKTQAEIDEMRAEHPDDAELDFEEKYCLQEIPHQPHGYLGRKRYCSQTTHTERWYGSEYRFNKCRYHGANRTILENVQDKITHGMDASNRNLKNNFSPADKMLYDTIMEWAEDYGFKKGSPEYMQLESLALAKVREMRAEEHLAENGEVVEREIRDPETGAVLSTEEDVHPLSDNLRLKKKTIMSMMAELGLTPKAKSSIGKDDAQADEAEMISEMASQALDSDNGEYNADEFTDDETN